MTGIRVWVNLGDGECEGLSAPLSAESIALAIYHHPEPARFLHDLLVCLERESRGDFP